MNSEALAGVFAATLVLAPTLMRRMVRWLLPRPSNAALARGRATMPSLPRTTAGDGPAGARFDRAVRRATGRLLRDLASGAEGVEATALAGRVGSPPEVVAAALRDMAAQVPHRLRVTSGGALLYDFEAAQIATLVRGRRRAGPGRAAVFALSGLANLGAAWPPIAAIILYVLVSPHLDVALVGWLLLAPLVVAALLGLVGFAMWLVARAVRRTVSRSDGGVRLGPHPGGEGVDTFDACFACIWSLGFTAYFAPLTLLFWFVGLWRSSDSGAAEPLSPADWVRIEEPREADVGVLSEEETVLQLVRSARRSVDRPRPDDPRLPLRLLRRAAGARGRLALLEVVLNEALGPEEAARVGAALAAGSGGDIRVTEGGEVEFVWSARALSGAKEEERVRAEDPVGKGRKGKKGKKGKKPDRARKGRSAGLVEHGGFEFRGLASSVPVNLPGMSLGYLRGGERLVAGALIMTLAGWCSMMQAPTYPDVAVWHGGGFLALLVLTLSAYLVLGLSHGAARREAEAGLLRDVRRATMEAIRDGLAAGRAHLDASALSADQHEAAAAAWRNLSPQQVAWEVDAACMDLDLDVALEASGDAGGATLYDLEPLALRLEALAVARAATGPPSTTRSTDSVVFDTASSPA